MGERLISSVAQQVGSNNQQVQNLTEQVNQGIENLGASLSSLAQQLGSNNQSAQTVDRESVNQENQI